MKQTAQEVTSAGLANIVEEMLLRVAQKRQAWVLQKTGARQSIAYFIARRFGNGDRAALEYLHGNRHTRRRYEAEVHRMERRTAHQQFQKTLKARYQVPA